MVEMSEIAGAAASTAHDNKIDQAPDGTFSLVLSPWPWDAAPITSIPTKALARQFAAIALIAFAEYNKPEALSDQQPIR
jgi:hypothetical protein